MAASLDNSALEWGPRSWSGRSRGPGRGGCGGKVEDKKWVPVIKLDRLVKDMKSLEEIYLLSLPIEQSELIDFFLGASLK